MIEGIIFDLDDTLLQTKQTKFKALQTAGKQFYNLDITDEHLLAHWGKPFPTLMDELFNRVEATDRIIENYMSIVGDFKNQAYDDALYAVNILSRSFHLGVLSSASRRLVTGDLQNSGFHLNTFMYIQSADDTEVHKPNPEVFQPLLMHFGEKAISASQLLYVGDMETDYQASKGAGMHFVGIARTPASEKAFANVHAPALVTLRDLPAYIEALGG